MMRCEDWPCCGHDVCPDFDETGKQLNMRCVCGKELPLNNPSSLCRSCLKWDPDELPSDEELYELADEEDYYDDETDYADEYELVDHPDD
jgi:hypothetical protein